MSVEWWSAVEVAAVLVEWWECSWNGGVLLKWRRFSWSGGSAPGPTENDRPGAKKAENAPGPTILKCAPFVGRI